jgi:hypothetical protein
MAKPLQSTAFRVGTDAPKAPMTQKQKEQAGMALAALAALLLLGG